MTYKEFLTQINEKKVSNVTLILGDQPYLQQNFRKALKSLIPEEELTMNFAAYDMETTPVSQALADAASAPFFGERRLVFIDNPYFFTGSTKRGIKVNHDLDELLAYLEHPQPDTILVFFAPYEKLDARKKISKQLKKVAEVVDISNLKEPQIRQIIQTELKQNGFTIEPSAEQLLLERTNADLTLIMNELPKLQLFRNDTKVIDDEAVTGLVTKTLDQNVFDLVSAVLARDTELAIRLYQDLLLSKVEPLQINAILVGQFRLLLQVHILNKHGYSQGTLASTLKVHPYRVKLSLQTVRHFDVLLLQRAYLGLIDVEKKLKSTAEDPEMLFEMFMVQYNNTSISA
ncbi:DNA polymerase III delta subunit [Secundilactobacillus oryzae JCM 18671]|uniref:DNA polymerase III subunit delta n=1 Tax=Secundilactobacillus oryzae JCM 18671 TaxID=1291743 RepID=A0A081BGS9_9LACO|nr:DNA polymerase III subunit delta [Secundilactobacillus oryzae]GAK47247.1 DNA polymerase III delta subunit [Secundilactobacillus oryzae JCM 18671]